MKQPTAAGRPTQPNNTQVATDPLLLSVGEGSAFSGRSQREEVAGAVEVQEESELEVELPIDQVEAREVEEESGQRGIEPSGISEGLQGRRLPGRLPMGVGGRDVRVLIADVFHNQLVLDTAPMCSFRRCLTRDSSVSSGTGQSNNPPGPGPAELRSDGRRAADTPSDGAAMSSPGLQV
ncbi:unnamed protein product [Arctogadus glacialis]